MCRRCIHQHPAQQCVTALWPHLAHLACRRHHGDSQTFGNDAMCRGIREPLPSCTQDYVQQHKTEWPKRDARQRQRLLLSCKQVYVRQHKTECPKRGARQSQRLLLLELRIKISLAMATSASTTVAMSAIPTTAMSAITTCTPTITTSAVVASV